MTAVQVRDFPTELYAELKDYAAKEHRSVSQQIIVAVEDMIRTRGIRQGDASVRCGEIKTAGACPGTPYVSYDGEDARMARIKKRKEIFARIHEVAKDLPRDLPDPLTILHEGRRERDEQLERAIGLPFKEASR